MQIYDVTLPIFEGLAVWPGDPAVTIKLVSAPHEPAVRHIAIGSHAGTHVDAPAHFVPGGVTVERLPLDVLLGQAWVADLEREERLDAVTLARSGIPYDCRRLLLRTRHSAASPCAPFDPRFVGLEAGAAAWLLGHGIRLVGIDAPSIEPFDAPHEPVHRSLLAAGVVIIEGLRLAAVAEGPYDLVCLPLAVQNGDGAPARVVLIRK